MAELRPRRIFRRAEQARDREGAAGIGPGGASRQRLALQPAAQEAGHEGIAGTEHVVDLDRETLADDTGLEIVRDRSVIDDAAHGAALQHDRRRGERADGLQRAEHVVGAGGDADLLLGADDQVAIRQDRPQLVRDAVGFHITLETGRVSRKAPEIGAVVDVEHDLAAGSLGDADRLALRRIGIRPREMRSRDHDGSGRGDEALVDVVFAERHVGAVGAVEDHGRDALILDGEQYQRGQPLLVGGDALDRDALADHLLADEASHLLVADPRHHAGLEAEPRRADRDVGGAAADRFREGGDVLQTRSDLLAVEVDGRAADGDDVERFSRSVGLGHRDLQEFMWRRPIEAGHFRQWRLPGETVVRRDG